MAGKLLEFKLNDEWANWYKENSWASFVPKFAKDENQHEYMRNHLKKEHRVAYKIVKEEGNKQEYRCDTCNSEIQGARIAHPIWDGPFPCSGSGQVHYEQIPYCPKCEEKPNFNGSPIRVKDSLFR